MDKETREIVIPSVLTVKELSDLTDISVNNIITVLFRFGIMATINQDIDFDTAQIVADEFNINLVTAQEEAPTVAVENEANKTERPPVVTIMGHVDHGKTTLLDAIRNTSVAEKEAGGITQAISSYQVNVNYENKERIITFVDTPGHSAFEAMRQHGASITDLVVLVVAANDGVKPQTIETIKHARRYNVPILVAINKIDLPEADVERTKRELADQELIGEAWGGQTVMVEVSAKKREGLDSLLDSILLVTDLMELKANEELPASGVVIESELVSGLGPIAVVLIQNGSLKLGDIVAIGSSYGKVRLIEDYRGKKIRLARPSQPVRIAGLSTVPSFGERLVEVDNEHEARAIARQNNASNNRDKIRKLAEALGKNSRLVGNQRELLLVVKADTQGSLNAITELVQSVSNDDVVVRVLKSGVGLVSEQDIEAAATSKATIIVFNQKNPTIITKLADQKKVQIHTYKVIYELEQLINEVVRDLMPELLVEREVAKLQILKRFRDNRKKMVVGGSVEDGDLEKGQKIVIRKGAETVAAGTITELRVGKEIVTKVRAGKECGVEFTVQEGDETAIAANMTLLAIIVEKVKKTV
ncbi:MAG: translation initiation factor IF-2 [bacterium]|nr:translation initiation factor IF-2 [bacterium]